MDEKCRNCKYSYYYAQYGYVCTNVDGEYEGDFMDGADWCGDYREEE